MRTTRGPAQELRQTIDQLPLEVRQAVLEGINSKRIVAGTHVDGRGGVCPMEAANVPWWRIGRTSVERAQAAARAWDRYTDATGKWHPATKRQLVALRAMLEVSILQDSTATELSLSGAIADHERRRTPEQIISELERYSEAERARRSRMSEDLPPITRPTTPAATPVARPAPPVARPAPTVARPAMPVARPARRRRLDTGERDRTSELRQREGWSWLRLFRNYDDYEGALQALAEIEEHAAAAERELVMR